MMAKVRRRSISEASGERGSADCARAGMVMAALVQAGLEDSTPQIGADAASRHWTGCEKWR
jgi:hypothetical protein